MGCNQLSFSVSVSKESRIVFSNGISTKMYCDDMKLEDSFSQAITTMTNYSVDKQTLTLTSKDGGKMVFVAKDLE
jgi:heat shock protein HslJ